jgi:hypothetical protein
MNRHGKVAPSAAGAQSPAPDPRAPRAIANAGMRPPGPVPGAQYCAKEQRSGLSAFTAALPNSGYAIADTGRRSKSP